MEPYLNRDYKQILDRIHGYISITRLADAVINTPEFYRLKKLHQLGVCHAVFVDAVHTRFEHSIGTYHLCGRMLDCIARRNDPGDLCRWLERVPEVRALFGDSEIGLTPTLIEIVKLAALCHDLGHGPYSHLFDDAFLTEATSPAARHEHRSGMIFRRLVARTPALWKMLSPAAVELVVTLIDPPHDATHSGFLFQIVSNNRNGVDADKFDYLVRDSTNTDAKSSFDHRRMVDDIYVIDDRICYPRQIKMNLFNLFQSRYDLHKRVYSHKVVIAVQSMVVDFLKLIDDEFKLSSSIDELDRFCLLTEEYLDAVVKHKVLIEGSRDPKLRAAVALLERIERRDHYALIQMASSDKPIEFNAVKYADLDGFNERELIVYRSTIGYVSGTKDNPLDHLQFYDRKAMVKHQLDPTVPIPISYPAKSEISSLIGSRYQEHLLFVFYRESCSALIEQMRKTV